MARMYGNLMNRLEEGRNFTGREIKVGDDITMYLWSDRQCYYVTDVIDQKHIKVKRYYVCADRDKAYGMGHQDWVYFKDPQKYGEYLGHAQENIDILKSCDREEAWVFRYGKWMSEHVVYGGVLENPEIYSERDRKSFQKNGYLKTYSDLAGNVSFGVRDYHYDWEF